MNTTHIQILLILAGVLAIAGWRSFWIGSAHRRITKLEQRMEAGFKERDEVIANQQKHINEIDPRVKYPWTMRQA